MNLPQPRFFIGFPIDSLLDSYLNQLDPDVKKLFINTLEPNYLQELQHTDASYLGKFVDNPINFPSLELMQNNICSLIQKILPDYSLNPQKLLLICTLG